MGLADILWKNLERELVGLYLLPFTPEKFCRIELRLASIHSIQAIPGNSLGHCIELKLDEIGTRFSVAHLSSKVKISDLKCGDRVEPNLKGTFRLKRIGL